MPDRDREKKSPHQGSGSHGQSAHGQHGQDRPRDAEGHFTGGSTDEESKSGRQKRAEDTEENSEDEG